MMGTEFRGTVLGLFAAAATAVLVLLCAGRPWSPREDGSSAGWGGPLALGLAFALVYLVTQGWPPVSFELGVKQWLFHAGLYGGLYGAYEALGGRRSMLTRAVLAFAAPYLFLEFMRQYHWNRTESILWTLGLAGLLFLSWNALESLAARLSRPALPLAWALVGTLSALALGLSGSTPLAQLAGGLAAALLACAGLARWRADFRLSRGAIAPYVLVHSGLLWAGKFASQLSLAALALLSLAPLCAWASELAPPASRRWRDLLVIVPPTAVALVALLLDWTLRRSLRSA